ncbi:MAG: hypothetical protein M1825_005965 [Sarcosagium campestre]|nr:MAG: hypothetical protein M1825_005965 [Sarcosagium campestre]
MLRLVRVDGSVLDYSREAEGTLVPSQKEVGNIDASDVDWVLVIEKEATFRSLTLRKAWDSPTLGKGVLVTGKGYPDIATRAFLRLLSSTQGVTGYPPTMHALVDYDPHGISILSTYKYGSVALAHENHTLVVPSLQWTGVDSCDLGQRSRAFEDDSAEAQQVLPLTLRDRRLAVKLLAKGIFAENGPEPKWRREVQVMLMLNIKVEMQIMGEMDNAWEAWLVKKIANSRLPIS